MKHLTAFFLTFFASFTLCCGQITDPKATEVWQPEPRVVTPGQGTKPPSDAIVLFNGTGFSEWVSLKDSAAAVSWNLARDSSMTVQPGTGDIMTKRVFGDCQLHLEFRTPLVVKGEGQGRGNSGVFLQDRYEVQVLDSYQNRTYSNGQCASIYKQTIPLVNACRPPGEWQTYDILFTAPRFNADGILLMPGRVTVIQNGVVVQMNTEIKGTTEYIGLPRTEAHGKAPIRLQDHGDLVSYRNIWLREL
ncbi:MAG: DUF1080 domain-containing protein [Saprospiraceae bacterium]|nr:DUF1080 domain-containing protein [Saprospiraceae bacterium]